MSKVLHQDTPCARCGETMPKGTRADTAGYAPGGVRQYVHRQPCARPAAQPTEPLATERQIAYALDLLARAPRYELVGDAFERPTPAEVRTMTRDQISRLITELTTEL